MSSEFWKNNILILDGAMGTELQKRGLPPGAEPALWGLDHPQVLAEVHRKYIGAGSRVIYANTFGAGVRRLAGSGHTPDELVSAAVAVARQAAAGTDVKVALDIGPLGELLEPMGSLSFEAAYEIFRQIAVAGARAGADLAVIETMVDLYEAKAALLAVKENTSLPCFVTMSVEESGRTFTGCAVASMARTLEGLGADAVGLNCSLGPDKLAPLLAELARNTRLPVIAKPNAGLPDPTGGGYDLGPEAFAAAMLPCLEAGASIVGGCCGTSPEYIRSLQKVVAGRRPAGRAYDAVSFVCTPSRPCRMDGGRAVGTLADEERLRQALLEDDLDEILDMALEQEDDGADLLDVYAGYPGIDEAETLPRVVKYLQGTVSLPLRLGFSDPAALEAALRVYNGKAAVRLNGGEDLERALPIVKKYGAAVAWACPGEQSAPRTEEARRILDAALSRGIPREDVWIDDPDLNRTL